VQKFTLRAVRSGWSKKNVAHVDRLVQEGRKTPAGLKEVEAAKADGRWATAYDSSATAPVPAEFVKELARNARAKQFYATLNKANLYSIAYRLQTAAPGDHDQADKADYRNARARREISLTADASCVEACDSPSHPSHASPELISPSAAAEVDLDRKRTTAESTRN